MDRLSKLNAVLSHLRVVLAPYRGVLALPGVRALTLIALLARIPEAAIGVILTLHVVLSLGMGYAAAGMVGAASTIGTALGAPMLGRIIDRRGLRSVLVISTITEAVFWCISPWLPYPALLALAFIAGCLVIPVMSIARQGLAALVPEDQLRTMFSVDSILADLAWMVGPAAGTLLAVALSPTVAMLGVGAALTACGIGMYAMNPRMKSDTSPAGKHTPRRTWLTAPLVAMLIMTFGSLLTVAGTDVAIVATLQKHDQLAFFGAVMAFWCLASIVGGLLYGSTSRPVSPLILLGLLGLFTVPVGVSHQWWLLVLLVIPCGLFCGPALTSASNQVATLAPESVRGEAMGLLTSATTIGVAAGAPLIGFVIDNTSTEWGFVVAGATSLLALGLMWLIGGRQIHSYSPTNSAATDSAIS